ncbi:hypothetical protein KCP71_23130 [Salmonella enterica subsp. enterica]|nr:hypothetical protein KCP71_23130 [Salmonella enterica subsp. enterica]
MRVFSHFPLKVRLMLLYAAI